MRSKNQAMSLADYAAIKLRSEPYGAHLLLGDIAQIHETVGEKDFLARIDGKPDDQFHGTISVGMTSIPSTG